MVRIEERSEIIDSESEKSNNKTLLVNSVDEKLDQAFRGSRRVLTGYREEMVVQVELPPPVTLASISGAGD